MAYTYDAIGQLKTAKGTDTNSVRRLHEQLGYAYDAAGNLNYRTNNALVQTFAVNNLNQLTNVARGGTLTVAGTTTGPATNVTVNTSNAARYADFTFAATNFVVTNSYSAIAKDTNGRISTHTISVNLPASVTNQYDANGNLTYDGQKSFEWDDENQLVRITRTNNWKSEFVYDGKMRRRVRTEYLWLGGSWALSNEVRYVYDGNLVIQERDGYNVPNVTYTRGRDLSGSSEGAGGIGGLLARTDHSSLNSGLPSTLLSPHAYYHADGNGNVTMLINTQQLVAARYQYDPFGNTLALSGSLAEANLYRFSSKEWHPSSGLAYYLYRYYAPEVQRWVNRDPISKQADVNLYRFVRNAPVDEADAFGLIIIVRPCNDPESNACGRMCAPSPVRVCLVATDYQLLWTATAKMCWCGPTPTPPPATACLE